MTLSISLDLPRSRYQDGLHVQSCLFESKQRGSQNRKEEHLVSPAGLNPSEETGIEGQTPHP